MKYGTDFRYCCISLYIVFFRKLLHIIPFFKVVQSLCVSKGSCVKSDKLPQVMSSESVSFGTEDYKFENHRRRTSVTCSSLLFEASGSRLQ